jgi:clan AA aspartic protease (TIGR02281 family)
VAFNKSFAGKSDTIISQLFLADHFYFKSQKVNDKRAAHAKQIGTKPKPTPEDLKKRADLDKEYGDAFEQLRGPSEKVAAFYAAHGALTAREKQQYKKVIGYLSDIYGYKKIMSKTKPIDQAKYAEEEKKWNDRYESVSVSNIPNASALIDGSGVIQMKETSSGVYTVPCEINGLKMNFIFDSGASDVSISLTEAQFMLKNGYLKLEDILDKESYQIANGQLIDGLIINIRELKIGNYTIRNIKGSIVASNSAPLLFGMTAIKMLGLKFDPSRGTLSK